MKAVPDARKHRGPGPQDGEWFGDAAVPSLAAATADLSWLFSRGYAEPSALKLVGDRHQLTERQRTAVRRSACSDAALADRQSRQASVGALRGKPLRIDGFNLILSLESALGGGVLLVGRDGCLRDLASIHGTYRRVEETRPALELASRCLTAWGVGPCTWFLDAPVSNSGRLASLIRLTNPMWLTEVVPDPDAVLRQPGGIIATADAGILDRCDLWANLARAIVAAGPSQVRVLNLGKRGA